MKLCEESVTLFWNYTVFIGDVNAGETKTAEFTKDELGIISIELKFKNATTNARIEAKQIKFAGDESPISDNEKLDKYLKIDPTNFNEDYLTGILINFKINSSWFIDKECNKDKVSLKEYVKNEWSTLKTTKAKEDSKWVYYKAPMTNFATLAITAEKGIAKPAVKEAAASNVREFTEEDIFKSKETEKKAEETKGTAQVQKLGIIARAANFIRGLFGGEKEPVGAVVGSKDKSSGWTGILIVFVIISVGLGGYYIYLKKFKSRK